MLPGTWSAKAYSFFDTLLWIACLNILWIAFTVAGLGVLGAGPATAAAHIMIRKRIRGELAPLFRSFPREVLRNFVKANALALPVMGIAVAMVLNWNYFSGSSGVLSNMLSLLTLVAGVLMAGALCYLFPMFARYELGTVQYLLTSSRFAFRHLAGTVILLFVTAAAVFASQAVPGLVPFFSIGAWLFVTGWLCDKFFTANDESLADAEADADADARPVPSLGHAVSPY
ncbi:DUF624 domain-containing protein [Pseudarthrobacter sp. J75]|uniref:YesL family protein n=1 Tax=unclassified Pseudarthrobacter TaxID=2647000 RepID=UPI002E810950|nr:MULTISPECIES: DUF624 domain-containing protein [unclassified Pseudarthrobacter]MEE2522221.1 DUF624 domain-containing protein [Pseudarthrobacter sp. J47]MEE2528133.1 DUF624 domain-containing protein [Pseudarthrobacter sp. J75]MEE2567835.1 DUF624 domain-containing protein [Pseudarthrobacter sp. J64]